MHYYNFHIGDYASHTRHLDYIEDLAYRRLLDMYYMSEKPIIADQAARLIGMREHGHEVLCVLMEFFTETDEGFINKRADDEIASFKAMSEGGKKGAQKRWGNKVNEEAIATLSPSHSHPIDTLIATNNQEPITNVITQDKPAKVKKVGHSIPDDFEPNESCVALASELGISWKAEISKFRDHHLQKGTLGKDWNAGFRTWLNNAVKFGTATKVSSTESVGNPGDLIVVGGRTYTRAGLEAIRRMQA